MVKAEWGTKRTCPSCGARYYDMKKNPPVCPQCGTAFDPEALLKSRRRAVAEEKIKRPVVDVVETPEDLEDIDVAATGDSEDAVIEDAEELGEDEAELEDVVEIEDEDPAR